MTYRLYIGFGGLTLKNLFEHMFHLYICYYTGNQNAANYFRYGQTKPVFAYRLMAHGTMEEKIYKRQVIANYCNYFISCST